MQIDTTTFESAKLAVTTLATGLAAFYGIRIASSQRDIARRQAATATEGQRIATAKLNLDLFNRRLPIYAATRNILIHLAGNIEGIDLSRVLAFNELIPEASFLFEQDVVEYMRQIVDKAHQLSALTHTLGLGPHYATQEVQDKHTEHQHWFFAQMGMYHARFAPYLDFASWRSS